MSTPFVGRKFYIKRLDIKTIVIELYFMSLKNEGQIEVQIEVTSLTVQERRRGTSQFEHIEIRS